MNFCSDPLTILPTGCSIFHAVNLGISRLRGFYFLPVFVMRRFCLRSFFPSLCMATMGSILRTRKFLIIDFCAVQINEIAVFILISPPRYVGPTAGRAGVYPAFGPSLSG